MAPVAQARAASLLVVDAVIARTIQRLRGCTFDFSSMGVASCAARLGHRDGEEHNCD
ncbi:hypothetical protein LJR235_002259 [Pararhizobium sp. LjRoot235]|uniref:hypothetical protein n=1 Tax=Pararhizobium sp. LjRoot235 TaxID=3342291 RepID=UPI003ECE9638